MIHRWFYQCAQPGSPGIAPLDVRLGLFADRMTPALAEVIGRFAADLTQQSVIDMLSERFAVRPGVEAYRRIVDAIASEVRTEHDEAAIDQLAEWIRHRFGDLRFAARPGWR